MDKIKWNVMEWTKFKKKGVKMGKVDCNFKQEEVDYIIYIFCIISNVY